jgi:prepilin-type N-terminal cleavage/methylation domain-containing protein
MNKPGKLIGMKRRKSLKGFTLIETLISMMIFCVIALGAMETMSQAKQCHRDIIDDYELREGVFAALTKIRTDAMEAGRGLSEPLRQKILSGVTIEDNQIQLTYLETGLTAGGDLPAGQTVISLLNKKTAKKGKRICLLSEENGELAEITAVDGSILILSSPLNYSYKQNTMQIFLLETVRYFLDKKNSVLRRKVNSSPAQPLLEKTNNFICSFDNQQCYLEVSIQIIPQKERAYEISLVPPNLRLVHKIAQ